MIILIFRRKVREIKIAIINGYIIDPLNNVDKKGDILLDDGKIIEIRINDKDNLPLPSDCKIIDAEGMIVVPGLIDMHCHLREPGFEYKETIRTGSEAASSSGFTSICCMPNTNPVNDNQAVTEFIKEKGKKDSGINIFPIGAITKGSKGEELSEISDLKNGGCVAVSDDGHPVMNSEVMRRALEYTKGIGITVISHCEDINLSKGGVINESLVSTEMGLRGIPNASEEIMIYREIALAELTGGRLHIAHISTEGGVRLLRDAKMRGINVTGETCPHYFILTDEAVKGFNANAKVNPPLRSGRDVSAIRSGLKDGTIDVIATDHAPHAVEEKEREMDYAPFGISGFETALSLSLRLVEDGVLSLSDLFSKLTCNPSKILGLNKGSIGVGDPADIAIIKMDEEWVVDPAKFRSKGRNTPFAGWKLKGIVYYTIVDGEIVWEKGHHLSKFL